MKFTLSSSIDWFPSVIGYAKNWKTLNARCLYIESSKLLLVIKYCLLRLILSIYSAIYFFFRFFRLKLNICLFIMIWASDRNLKLGKWNFFLSFEKLIIVINTSLKDAGSLTFHNYFSRFNWNTSIIQINHYLNCIVDRRNSRRYVFGVEAFWWTKLLSSMYDLVVDSNWLHNQDVLCCLITFHAREN